MIQGALVASGQKPTNQSNISKRLGDAWKNETDEVRAIYEERARHIREQHARDHPGFQYNKPRKGKLDRAADDDDDDTEHSTPSPPPPSQQQQQQQQQQQHKPKKSHAGKTFAELVAECDGENDAHPALAPLDVMPLVPNGGRRLSARPHAHPHPDVSAVSTASAAAVPSRHHAAPASASASDAADAHAAATTATAINAAAVRATAVDGAAADHPRVPCAAARPNAESIRAVAGPHAGSSVAGRLHSGDSPRPAAAAIAVALAAERTSRPAGWRNCNAVPPPKHHRGAPSAGGAAAGPRQRSPASPPAAAVAPALAPTPACICHAGHTPAVADSAVGPAAWLPGHGAAARHG
ncbi:hypothetical protein GQ42DRAFT_154279 [Ramicandelaber brevisporus]|nr:hypothetical protein GQ42DRAFT_154279 [Ramicandelaber brevisporus]